MSDLQNLWQAKTDEEVVEAGLKLGEYLPEGQAVIRGELRRRGLPEPETKSEFPTQTMSSALNLEADSTSLARIQNNVMNRYWDAYIVARAAVGIGGVVKIGSIFVAMISVILGFVASSEASSGFLVIGGILVAVVFGAPIYVLGILVSAQGETLKASLDTAVNSSTFLNNEQRAKVMSLL